jgi:hypothetical protein
MAARGIYRKIARVKIGRHMKGETKDGHISLTENTGKKIADILGYFTKDFEGYTFTLYKLVFDDGSFMWVEGKPDEPYLCEGSTPDPIVYPTEKETEEEA